MRRLFNSHVYPVLLLVPLLLVLGCGTRGASEGPAAPAAPVSDGAWQALEGKKIYFGHKSVGMNIVDGISDVLKGSPKARLQVTEQRSDPSGSEGVLLHGPVGHNGDPTSKFTAFEQTLDGGLGEWADLAFFKLCFVDIGPKTDVPALFRGYEQTMERLRNRYPRVTFIHFTVPITARLPRTRAPWVWAKRIARRVLGRPDWDWDVGFYDNGPRNQYNEILRRRYAGREPVFDLAAIEAGSPQTGSADGPYLRSSFTEDGGHLNAVGREEVALRLLAFLGALAEEKTAGGGARTSRPAGRP